MDRAHNRERTAYHEAGHAVASLVLGSGYVEGSRFKSISIEEDHDSAGRTLRAGTNCLNDLTEDEMAELEFASLFAPPPDNVRRCLEFEILVACAGQVAEERLLDVRSVSTDAAVERGAGVHSVPGSDRAWLEPGSDADAVFRLANWLGGDPKRAYALQEALFVQMRLIMEQTFVWSLVEAIATALLDDGELSFAQCVEIRDRTLTG